MTTVALPVTEAQRENEPRGHPRVSVVVLAFGPEPILDECVSAILHSSGVDCDVVIVDNGTTSDFLCAAEHMRDVRVLRPGRNLGFAGGCNLAADEASGDYLAFVNSDAVVGEIALARLVEALSDPSVGIASASLRLYNKPHLMNSAGNPIHYLGLSWAGGLGQPASEFGQTRNIAGATGAAMVCRRDLWQALGGFFAPMFAYVEDSDLSLRVWQRGQRVVFVPDAVVLHRYEFSRNPRKTYLIERNRILMLFTLYEARTLVVLLPAFLALEIAVFTIALKQGWAREKVAGWVWLSRNFRAIASRRRELQRARKLTDAELAKLFTAEFSPAGETGVGSPKVLNFLSRLYWRFARKLLGA